MKQQKWLIIVGIILVLIITTFVLFKPTQKILSPTPTPVGGPSSPTRSDVPKDAKVYDVGESAPEGIGIPISVSEYGLTKLRSFNMQIEKNTFMPNTFSCYEGEVLKISITAVDKDYDVIQPDNGFKLIIKKGESKFLEGQMNAVGKFTFYCESCGGLNSKAIGYIIVVPKPIKQ